MRDALRQFGCGWLGAVLLTGPGMVFAAAGEAQQPSGAPTPNASPPQVSVPLCQPPQPTEYLLLIMSQTSALRQQVQAALPPGVSLTVCNYLNQPVTRVGGFTTLDAANSWAQYLKDSVGVTTYVARPAEFPAAQVATPPVPSSISSPATPTTAAVPQPTPAQPSRTGQAQSQRYAPQPLGSGYAVLVDYFNQPGVAAQVRQTLGQDVGLVSYGQRPYLLTVYTSDPAIAHTTLQTLSNQGFWAVVVDARRTMLLQRSIKPLAPTP